MKQPTIGNDVFIAKGAIILGDVTLGDECSVWYNAVIRADDRNIRIGTRTNIQDGSVLHVGPTNTINIGNDVTIGHGAIVHGCTVGDNTLIGMGAIVMNNAVIGKNCIVAAGALVTERTQIPDGSLVMGQPARIKRQVTPEEIARNRFSAQHYAEIAQMYET